MMGTNKDKTKTQEKKYAKVDTSTELPITIEVYDRLGKGIVKRHDRFGVKRIKEDNIFYLINEDKDFKVKETDVHETFFKFDTIEEYAKEIEKYKTKILDVKKKKKNESISDLEQDLFELQREQDIFINKANEATYTIIDENNKGSKPIFLFLRRGSNYIPLSFDLTLSKVKVPSDVQIKELSELIKETNEELKPNKINFIMIWGLIFLGVLVLGGMYFAFKTATLPAEFSGEVEIFARSVEQLTDIIAEINNVSEPLEPSIEPNVNIVN